MTPNLYHRLCVLSRRVVWFHLHGLNINKIFAKYKFQLLKTTVRAYPGVGECTRVYTAVLYSNTVVCVYTRTPDSDVYTRVLNLKYSHLEYVLSKI
jgi:hypothetical protein